MDVCCSSVAKAAWSPVHRAEAAREIRGARGIAEDVGVDCSPPRLYFCPVKFSVWAAVARRAREACDVTGKLFAKFFDRLRHDVASDVVGGCSRVLFSLGESLLVTGHSYWMSLLPGGCASRYDHGCDISTITNLKVPKIKNYLNLEPKKMITFRQLWLIMSRNN